MKPHSKPIFALVMLLLVAAAFAVPVSRPAQAAGTWYVAPPPTGSDSNDCLTPSTPCATINGAIAKAASGDTIKVAVGMYTGAGSEVVLINKNITLSGGWDASFASQSGMSTIDGGGARRGVTMVSGVVATVSHFVIQGGSSDYGGGLYNAGTLTINFSDIRNNQGGGIYTIGGLTLNNSSVVNNAGKGGIYKGLGTLTLNNSTISGNAGYSCGGVCNGNPGSISINSSTITRNSAYSTSGGGIENYGSGLMTLRNTILAGNTPSDCQDQLTLAGYNILGNRAGCTYLIASATDRVNLDPKLGSLTGSPAYHPLLTESPAINAGNPDGCTDDSSGPLNTDQRGMQRVGRCDIGAYEAGLSITKQVSGAPRASGIATYIVNLVNLGGSVDLTSVTLTDTLPNGLVYVPNSLSATNGVGTENQGVITWTGIVPSNAPTVITFSASVTTTLDLVITNTAISSWAGSTVTSSVSFNTTPRLYLPLLFNQYCPPTFFDDFSNPYSGWPVGEDEFVRSEYLGGEYRILTKNGDYIYLFRSPACSRPNYTVEMDARWVGTPGSSYGLLFGITSGFSQYYLFDMNTDYRQFRLYRRGASGFTQIAPVTYSSAIGSGTSTNHLKVTRNGGQITLAVNGTTLGTWYDGVITGSTWVGLMSSPYSEIPVSDARFDNFSVSTLGASSAAAVGGENVIADQASAPSSLTTLHMTLPPALEWRLPDEGIRQESK
jgi:uncharacterized repeat protein (TIGR01451 family)